MLTIQQRIDADLEHLTAIYVAWNKEQGLELGSADEHTHDEGLTEAQREWVREFSERWEYAAPYYGSNGVSSRKIDELGLMLTFEEFRQTARIVLEAEEERIEYVGGECRIDLVCRDEKLKSQGLFCLTIANDSRIGFDLVAFERDLYDWALGEGLQSLKVEG